MMMRCVDPSVLTGTVGRPSIATVELGSSLPLALGMDLERFASHGAEYLDRMNRFVGALLESRDMPYMGFQCRFGSDLRIQSASEEFPHLHRALVVSIHLSGLDDRDFETAERTLRYASFAARLFREFLPSPVETIGTDPADVAARIYRDQPDVVAAILAADVAACERRALEAEQAAEREAQAREHAADLESEATNDAAERLARLADSLHGFRVSDYREFAGLMFRAHPALIAAIMAMNGETEPARKPAGAIPPKALGQNAGDDLAHAELLGINGQMVQGLADPLSCLSDEGLLERAEAFRETLSRHLADASAEIHGLRVKLGIIDPADHVTTIRSHAVPGEPVLAEGVTWATAHATGVVTKVDVQTSMTSGTFDPPAAARFVDTFGPKDIDPFEPTASAEPESDAVDGETNPVLEVHPAIGRALGMVPNGHPDFDEFDRRIKRFARTLSDLVGVRRASGYASCSDGEVFPQIMFMGRIDPATWSNILKVHDSIADGAGVLEEARTFNWTPRA